MFGGSKIKLDKDLLAKSEKNTRILQVILQRKNLLPIQLRRKSQKLEESDSDSEEDIKKKLQGLGYIS